MAKKIVLIEIVDEPTLNEALGNLRILQSSVLAKTADFDNEQAKQKEVFTKSIASETDLMNQYSDAIEEFCRNNRELFPEGKKTLELGNGSVAFKSVPASLLYISGWDEQKSIAALEKDKSASFFVLAKKSIDKSGIKKAFDNGKFNNKTLSKFGLCVSNENVENFSIKITSVKA